MATLPWTMSNTGPGLPPLFPGVSPPISESVLGIVVPSGDPASLEQAAGRWAGMADVFGDQAAHVRAAVSTVTGTSWSGQAGTAFSAYSATLAGWFDQAAGGCRGASTACRQLATSLRDAQSAARTAISHASDAHSRSQVADTHLGQAHTRADSARQAATDAALRLSQANPAHPAGQVAYQAASDDHARAETDLGNAQADAQRAAGQKSAAQDDLQTAQKAGGSANNDAQQAERQASAAFHAAAQELTPSVCLAAPPVPIDPARGASPELILGAPGLAGMQPFAHSPADMRAQQIVDERAAAQAEADREQAAATAASKEGGIPWGAIIPAVATGVLTVVNVAQLGLDPVTDGAEVVTAGATLEAVAGDAAVETAALDAGAADSEIPTVLFSRTRAPGIGENFDRAVSEGHPTTLNRIEDNALRDANRREALRGQSPAPAGQSLDEYPFACTAQGGAGACVSAVPRAEQSYQGGVLSRFFQDNGLRNGDPFNVRFRP